MEWFVSLVSSHPYFSLFVGTVGALRLSVPVFVKAAKLIAKETPSPADDRLIKEFEESSAYTRFLAFADWLTSFRGLK